VAHDSDGAQLRFAHTEINSTVSPICRLPGAPRPPAAISRLMPCVVRRPPLLK
jgi:hypothetical protein